MVIAWFEKKVKSQNEHSLTSAGIHVSGLHSIGPRRAMSVVSPKLGKNILSPYQE